MLQYLILRNPLPRKKKVKTVSQLKKEADKVYSLHIRLKYADDNGMVSCYTCGKRNNYKEGMQCGHFISRSHLILRYDDRNCRVQCSGCNMWGKGKIPEFGNKLELETPGITSILFRE